MANLNPFQTRQPNIRENLKLRTPQREAYVALADYAGDLAEQEREVGVILPVGCGKSGCITLAPFAFRANRALVVAPGLHIAGQLAADFDPANARMFYQSCHVLTGGPYPEPVEIRGTTTNRADLDEAHVVITNIGQLQGGAENRWLQSLPSDFFDLILFDEGHHSVAESYSMLKAQFPEARIVNFSATPLRADGQIMAGRVLYSYPIFRAIQEGYVKRLKAVQLNPGTLRYVRREDDQEVEVSLDEVRRLGGRSPAPCPTRALIWRSIAAFTTMRLVRPPLQRCPYAKASSPCTPACIGAARGESGRPAEARPHFTATRLGAVWAVRKRSWLRRTAYREDQHTPAL